MVQLALVYAYYRNPTMLAHQYEVWASYPQEIKDQIEIVITDDCSPDEEAASTVPRPEGLPTLRLFRHTKRVNWNQNECRNVGAFNAQAEWLLLTDMDHIVPAETMVVALKINKPKMVFMFSRVSLPDYDIMLNRHGRPKPHPNSWLMTREMYWKIGGYDAFFSGFYGTDSFFRTRVLAAARMHILRAHLVRVPREVIADASTTDLLRKENRKPGFHRRMRERKLASPCRDKILTLQTPWEKVC